ncbi:hypothetical protein AB8613_14895 [Vibrio sp. BS-M-Sm-2]|uniref:hypothetical protein n=1 Tax=Vibrio sp. BS-M-Sm-2 TaxID=3241167 RepID=UPI0035574AA4
MRMMAMVLALISINVNAQNTKTLQIHTTLNIGNLYTSSIDSVQFTPSELTLVVEDSQRDRFKREETILMIETSIPASASPIAYTTKLTKNEAECKDYSGQTHAQANFVDVKIDDTLIEINQSKRFSFVEGQSNQYAEHKITLEFQPFNEIKIDNNQARTCTGQLEFSVEVDV